MDAWGWSSSKVQGFLASLVSEGMLEIFDFDGRTLVARSLARTSARSAARTITVLSVCNYESYQSQDQRDETINTTLKETLEPENPHALYNKENTQQEGTPVGEGVSSSEQKIRLEQDSRPHDLEDDEDGEEGKDNRYWLRFLLGRQRDEIPESAALIGIVGGKKRREVKVTGLSAWAFARFWAAFDLKHGLAGAIAAWAENVKTTGVAKRATEGAKIEAARRPALLARGSTPPYAALWLNQRRFDDEPSVEGKHAANGAYRGSPGATSGQDLSRFLGDDDGEIVDGEVVG